MKISGILRIILKIWINIKYGIECPINPKGIMLHINGID